jgi:hypothetical protein
MSQPGCKHSVVNAFKKEVPRSRDIHAERFEKIGCALGMRNPGNDRTKQVIEMDDVSIAVRSQLLVPNSLKTGEASFLPKGDTEQ